MANPCDCPWIVTAAPNHHILWMIAPYVVLVAVGVVAWWRERHRAGSGPNVGDYPEFPDVA